MLKLSCLKSFNTEYHSALYFFLLSLYVRVHKRTAVHVVMNMHIYVHVITHVNFKKENMSYVGSLNKNASQPSISL